ncbi:MAG: hypothetical protein AB7F43_11375 [Bacteriovoracia bacterium]
MKKIIIGILLFVSISAQSATDIQGTVVPTRLMISLPEGFDFFYQDVEANVLKAIEVVRANPIQENHLFDYKNLDLKVPRKVTIIATTAINCPFESMIGGVLADGSAAVTAATWDEGLKTQEYFVFLFVDRIGYDVATISGLSMVSPSRGALARYSLILGHEIYGHISYYLSMPPMLEIPTKKELESQELRALKDGLRFGEAVLKSGKQSQQEAIMFEKVLKEERTRTQMFEYQCSSYIQGDRNQN